jgi:hypothetical protein
VEYPGAKGAKSVLHHLARGHHPVKPARARESCAQFEIQSTVLTVPDPVPPAIQQTVQGRAAAHRRIRQAVSLKVRGLTVKPRLPPDLLGLLVLQSVVANTPSS